MRAEREHNREFVISNDVKIFPTCIIIGSGLTAGNAYERTVRLAL